MVVGMLGALLPALDEISLWSGFDQSVAPILGISEPGVEIFLGKHWFSHQAFMHSLLACFIFSTFILLSFTFIYKNVIKGAKTYRAAFQYVIIYSVAFGLGFTAHLLADLAAPAGPWGGIRLFFPFEIYVGGWGMTWWWNNYDLTLILFVATLLNVVLIAIIPPLKKGVRYLPASVCMFASMMIVWQISTRSFNFNEAGYTTREEASHVIQTQILGEDLHHVMNKMDQQLPFYY